MEEAKITGSEEEGCSPDETLKILSIESLILGDVETAEVFIKAALVINPNIFDDISYISVNFLSKESLSIIYRLQKNLVIRTTVFMENEKKDYQKYNATIERSYSDQATKEVESLVSVIRITPKAAMIMSKQVMSEALMTKEQGEDLQEIFNAYDFNHINPQQWKVISNVYSTVKFNHVRFQNAMHLNIEAFKELLRRSKDIKSITIDGTCLLADKDVYEILTVESQFKFDSLFLLNMLNITQISNPSKFPWAKRLVATDLNILKLKECHSLKLIDLDAPRLTRAKVINCAQLETFKLNAAALTKLTFFNCTALESPVINASQCSLDLIDPQLFFQSEERKDKFFSQCQVREKIYDSNMLTIKVVMYSTVSAGQSALVARLANTIYANKTTILDFEMMMIDTPNGNTIKLQFWDLTATEAYYSITYAYFRGAKLGIFSIPSHEYNGDIDLERAERTIKKIKLEHDIKHWILVGTKIDLTKIGEFKDSLKAIAEKFGMLGPVLTSSKTGQGIDELRELLRKTAIEINDKEYEIPEKFSSDPSMMTRLK